jgi:hypothetical protein
MCPALTEVDTFAIHNAFVPLSWLFSHYFPLAIMRCVRCLLGIEPCMKQEIQYQSLRYLNDDHWSVKRGLLPERANLS